MEDGAQLVSSDLDSKPEEELTTEERLAWLRQRGVIVEEPASRGRAPETSASRTFKYVKIPVDCSLDCEELSGADRDGDALPAILGPSYAGGDASEESLQAQIDSMGQAVSLSAMRSVMAKGGAESFRLAVPTDGNGREGVYAYLDEASALKSLPRNDRATALAHRCGFPGSCVLSGDIYIGRQKWRGTLLDNVDFNLPELEVGSLWQHRAVTENLEFQRSIMPEEHAAAQAIGLPDTEVSGEEDGYSWKDTGDEVEVLIPIAKGVSKKDVKVEFKKREIRVVKPVALSLKLSQDIVLDGCFFTLSDGQIVASLEKASPSPWKRLLA